MREQEYFDQLNDAYNRAVNCTCIKHDDGTLAWNDECVIHTPRSFRGMRFLEGHISKRRMRLTNTED